MRGSLIVAFGLLYDWGGQHRMGEAVIMILGQEQLYDSCVLDLRRSEL